MSHVFCDICFRKHLGWTKKYIWGIFFNASPPPQIVGKEIPLNPCDISESSLHRDTIP